MRQGRAREREAEPDHEPRALAMAEAKAGDHLPREVLEKPVGSRGDIEPRG